jgi:DNA polymerase bacteriophage-type
MRVLYRDYETSSTLDLTQVGAWRYAADATTRILCAGYAVDDGEVRIWTPPGPIPECFFSAAVDPDWTAVAHNDGFESALEERHLAPRYGWPVVPLARHACTMAAALASALPGSLEGAAAALGLPFQKDHEGQRLMRRLARRTNEDPNPEELRRQHAYCATDIELVRLLFSRLPPLSPAERALWALDQEINRRGFYVDLELAAAAQEIVQAEQAAIDRELAALTDGQVTSINQVAKIADWIRAHGHTVFGLTKRSVSALLAQDPTAEIKRLLELRQDGGRAAARKLDAVLNSADDDQRARGCFKFHGASTGRWSGSRIQPQNLSKAVPADLEGAIAAVRSGDLDRVRQFGPPLGVIGGLSRALICAASAHELIGADYSAIESRVLAWLADEIWKLDNYREYEIRAVLRHRIQNSPAESNTRRRSWAASRQDRRPWTRLRRRCPRLAPLRAS